MKPIESALIIGAGAVGSAVAGIIHRTSPGSVAILAEGQRLERYRRDGFVLNGVRQDFALIESGKPFSADLIIVAVKGHHLNDAISLMRPFVGPQTRILSLLNGITSEEILRSAFGTERVPLAMILGIDAVRVGNDTRFSSAGKIFFGDEKNASGALRDPVADIAKFFDRVGIPYEIPADMLRSLWYKFMINVGINQASVVLRAKYGVFQTNEFARSAMEAGMREVIAISKALGTGLQDADLGKFYETLLGLGSDGATSMLQDIEAGRKTEVELFAGTVIKLGEQTGVPTPVNQLWFDLIKTIERMNEVAQCKH